MRHLALAAAVLLAAPAPALAQAKPWLAGLTLSAEQQAGADSLQAIYGARFRVLRSEHSSLRTKRRNPGPDDAGHVAVDAEGQRIRRESADAMAALQRGLRALLTPDQQARFDANVAADDARRAARAQSMSPAASGPPR